MFKQRRRTKKAFVSTHAGLPGSIDLRGVGVRIYGKFRVRGLRVYSMRLWVHGLG